MSRAVALALFSGGLDSILACRLLREQDIAVRSLKFVTPFSDAPLLEEAAGRAYCERAAASWQVDVRLCDLSVEAVALLHSPPHGFGRNFNPCIDCKILMLRRARREMEAMGASFLVSGEVVGQRPMSQRRDTLRLIARESGCEDILLRPLSAQLLPPTRPEREGLVRRELLAGLSGRGRAGQMALAARFGLRDFPEPAGGCLLTDPILGERIARLYRGVFWFAPEEIEPRDLRLLHAGRQFCLDGGAWCILGRNEAENDRLLGLRRPEDWVLLLEDRPGPLALLRGEALRPGADPGGEAVRQAASLVVRFGRKVDGAAPRSMVRLETGAGDQPAVEFLADAADPAVLAAWKV